MRLVASGHTKRTAVAAFMRALDGGSALDVFQNGAVLQADATHYDPTTGQMLVLSGQQVVACVDESGTPGITLHLASCECGQVTASNETVSHCVACGDAVPASKLSKFEVEASEDTPEATQESQEQELELEGATEASFSDEVAEGEPVSEASSEEEEPGEEESAIDEGGWIAPGKPFIPEDKEGNSESSAPEEEQVSSDAASDPAAEAEDDTPPDYSLHTRQQEDVSMTKTIKATASNKRRASSIFARRLIASLDNKAMASDSQILTASDVLIASCPKCEHVTLSSAEFHELPGGVLACGHCKTDITASHLGLTTLTIDRTTAGEGEDGGEMEEEGANKANKATKAGDGEDCGTGEDDTGGEGETESEDGGESEDDTGGDGGEGDGGTDQPENEDDTDGDDETFDDADLDGDTFEEKDGEGEGMPAAEEETSEDEAPIQEDPAAEETSEGEEEAPMAETGDGEIVDEFEATDGEDDNGGDDNMENIDLLESSSVEASDTVELAFSSSFNRAPRWDLSVAGCVIATLEQGNVKGPLAVMASDSFTKQKFAVAMRTALGSNVTKNAKALGFNGVVIKSPIAGHVAAKVEAATKALAAKITAKERSLSADLQDALVVVAAGLNRGFYAATPHPMRASVFTALSNARVQGAARIANAAFQEHGETYAKTLVQLAFAHMAKPVEARKEIAQSILGMGYQAVAEDDEPNEDEAGEMPAGTSVPDEQFMDRLEQGFDAASDRSGKNATTTASNEGGSLSERIRGLKFGQQPR